MNTFDYDEKIKQIEKRYKNDIEILKEVYSKANNPYKINDIISDKFYTIKIDKIDFGYFSFGHHYPSCVYYGFILTKNGKPNKRKKRAQIWQENIINK